MTYYPVIIPTLNRYEHFKRCVESLARNTHADKTELIIGLDYPPSEKYEKGYKQIKEYLPSITGFKKITIFVRRENYGVHRNFIALQNYAFEHYNAVISTEDDNEFSPCFLDFMNKALDRYRNEERITTVGGFNQYSVKDQNTVLTIDSCAWGMGQWREKYEPTKVDTIRFLKKISGILKIFHNYRLLLPMLIGMIKRGKSYGDAILTCYNISTERYQVRSSKSLVRNWGHDGSGIHCGITDQYIKMEISNERFFNLQEIPIERTKAIDKQVRYNMMPRSFFKRRRSEIRIIINAISFYLICLFTGGK